MAVVTGGSSCGGGWDLLEQLRALGYLFLGLCLQRRIDPGQQRGSPSRLLDQGGELGLEPESNADALIGITGEEAGRASGLLRTGHGVATFTFVRGVRMREARVSTCWLNMSISIFARSERASSMSLYSLTLALSSAARTP